MESHEGITIDAIERETVALDVYAKLAALGSIGQQDVEDALLEVVRLAPPPAAPSPSPRPSRASPITAMRAVFTPVYVHDFVNAAWSGRLACFEDFVGVYNDMIDHAVGLPWLEEHGEHSERVLAMAQASARLSVNGRSPSPHDASPGSTRSTMRKSFQSPSMGVVRGYDQAPNINPTGELDAGPNGERSARRPRARGSSVGNSGEPTPEFVRAGVQKFDFVDTAAREEAKVQLQERRNSLREGHSVSPGGARSSGSPGGARSGGGAASPHGGSDGRALTTPRRPGEASPGSSRSPSRPPGNSAHGGQLFTTEAGPPPSTGTNRRNFRERRLSKDIIAPDDEADARESRRASFIPAELQVPGEPGAAEPASILNSPSSGRSSVGSARRSSREITIDEIVNDSNPEAALFEVSAGPLSVGAASPPRTSPPKTPGASLRDSALATPHDPATGASTGFKIKTVSFDRESEDVVPTPTRERKRPTQQPRTAAAHAKAQLLNGNASVAISQEMGADLSDLSISEDVVGSYSCHGMEPGDEGHVDKINQDCACCGHPFADLERTALFCVYDGHGKCGHEVSQECMHTIYQSLEIADHELMEDPCGTLADAFEACNIHLRIMACEEVMEVNPLDSGTCAVVAFLHDRELFVASVGDCRCVLGSKPWPEQPADGDLSVDVEEGELTTIALSTDHKADLPAEQARIEAKGGWVRPAKEPGPDDDDDFYVPARLYEKKGKPHLGPGLCVSRALGDLNALRCGLIPTPEVFSHVLGAADRYLILATDGVWEFISNEEAMRIVDDFYSKGLPAIDACRFLIAKAAVAWRQEEGDYRDDITAVVVYLPELLHLFDQSGNGPIAEEAPTEAGP